METGGDGVTSTRVVVPRPAGTKCHAPSLVVAAAETGHVVDLGLPTPARAGPPTPPGPVVGVPPEAVTRIKCGHCKSPPRHS